MIDVTVPVTIFWFRRDLRIDDNIGLRHALSGGRPVLPIFIFDDNILDRLERPFDRRVEFIHRALGDLQRELGSAGGSLLALRGKPAETFAALAEKIPIRAVYANRDYEPYAIERDRAVARTLERHGIPLKLSKDHVVFDTDEVVKDDGAPYTIFTPYMRKWKARLDDTDLQAAASADRLDNIYHMTPNRLPSLADLGFSATDAQFPPNSVNDEILQRYHETRDVPSIRGTSRLSVHLRFGTLSIRRLATAALQHNPKFLGELVWRDFYASILWHYPHVAERAFKPAYDRIVWRNSESEFEAWMNGRTGYPIVDAGMRELNATGLMHNRVRMIVASFLVKHLLIDWRWGEAYFAAKLLDFDLASNNGNWQWAASCGCDAVPYFRIFNPHLQTKKFDPKGRYIRAWVPEFQSLEYPAPIVEHTFARQRALETYRSALK